MLASKPANYHPSFAWFTIGAALAFASLAFGQPFVLLYAGLAVCYGLRFFDPSLVTVQSTTD